MSHVKETQLIFPPVWQVHCWLQSSVLKDSLNCGEILSVILANTIAWRSKSFKQDDRKNKTFTIHSCVTLQWRVFIHMSQYSRCNNCCPAYNHIPLPWYNDPHPTKGQHHIHSPQRKCSVVILSFQIWSKLQQCRERTLCKSYLMGIVELRDKKRKPWS